MDTSNLLLEFPNDISIEQIALTNLLIDQLYIDPSEAIDKILELKDRDFELFICLFFRRMGYSSRLTKKSNDHGIDVLVQIGDLKIGIEAKGWKLPSQVGSKVVVMANGGKTVYDCDKAWVITTSFFTNNAKMCAEKCDVKLTNRDQLIKLLFLKNDDIKKIDFYSHEKYSSVKIENKKEYNPLPPPRKFPKEKGKNQKKEFESSIQYLLYLGELAASSNPTLKKNYHYMIKKEGKKSYLYFAPLRCWEAFDSVYGVSIIPFESSRGIFSDLKKYPWISKRRSLRIGGMQSHAWKIDLHHNLVPIELVESFSTLYEDDF